ncbi:IS110 family transposase [Streptomyces sp. NPDC002133]|uniref:IS110 family transposase n=1 Tax=Streptomyces sp. NPDC002133 TaxID=3154409 RepID=UPI00331CBFAC
MPEETGMDVVVARCAGLDVHRDTVVATVRWPGKRKNSRGQETRTYATTQRGLAELSDWLLLERVELVGMEATGIYWKPVFSALEERFTCWLLNAQHMHNVPGRKTDVADSVWIAQLLEHGLVRPSFVPPREMRDLRDLTRSRTAVTQERARMIQRLEKVLQDAGIKLTSVASQAYSKSARAILDALVDGERDPKVLASLVKGRLRSKRERLEEALGHRFRVEHHGVLARRLLANLDTLDAAITELDAEIARRLEPHQLMLELLCTIPGVGPKTVQVLVAEIGLDMSIFPSSGHLASWAGICPGNNASGGKRRSGRTRPGSRWLKQALTEAAWGAARAKGTYLAAHHAQIRGRAGRYKAIGATRHDIIVAYWHIARDQVPFRELGADWVSRRYSPEHRARRLIAQLEELGLSVTTKPAG